MNIYFIGMCIAMALFLVISYFVSKKVKNANDFYVAGRNAPLVLIAGSIIASYTSTATFMGDAATSYDGAFVPVIITTSMQCAGYIIGVVFFGRFLRRSGAMTIPEYFGKRFDSLAMRRLAGITAIIMMSVYMLSVIQGVGTLMSVVTGMGYNFCMIFAVVILTAITVISGSRGVLITDTLMSILFTLAMVVSVFVIANAAGGWFPSIEKLAANPETREVLSWAGKPGTLFETGIDNMIWAFVYGIVWMSVCAIGPWQSSRYIMARNEHTAIRSAPIASFGIFFLEFIACMAAVIVKVINPDIQPSSQVLIWAAINLLPKLLGVVLMTGVLSAGISSATTFLSLIGASMTNDIVVKDLNSNEDPSTIKYGRIAMVAVSIIVLLLALTNPPAIFVISFMGGSTAASSWMPVAFGSVFSKRMTKVGAFCGMFMGMAGCLVGNILKNVVGIYLPSYLDPAIIGIVCNVIAIIIGSALSKVTDRERENRESLFVLPDEEKDKKQQAVTLKWIRATVLVGAGMTAIMLIFWVIPYTRGLR